MKYAQFIFDKVFNIYTYILLFVAGFIFLIIDIDAREDQARAERQAKVAACFNSGMVLVETEAGQRCAEPKNLIAIK